VVALREPQCDNFYFFIMTTPYFPFSKIVGQDRLKEALLLNAINPAIGGVLIFGEKGTAKSTAVRGLKKLLDGDDSVPLVEMPLSATEEMVVGSIDISKTLKTQETQVEYGLLHKAHGGILYIDEANLLEDHLVNAVLDSAAMGVNRIEREGISHEHPAKFILIGTMNPEEGELRPQFLDRFGISVQVKTEKDLYLRKMIVTRRLSWESDPQSFIESAKEEDESFQQTINKGKEYLPLVQMPDTMLDLAVQLVLQSGAEGHRADLVIVKTAKTLSALNGRMEVTEADVYRAAEYALNHRGDYTPPPEAPDDNNESSEEKESPESDQNESPLEPNPNSSFQAEQTPEPQQFETLDLVMESMNASNSGKTSRKKESASLGKTRGYTNEKKSAGLNAGVAFFHTIVNGIRKGKRRLDEIDSRDLRFKRKLSGLRELHLLVLDASASMGTKKRLSYAKGLAQRILKRDYEKKNYVAVVTAQGNDANVLLKPTRNFLKTEQVLNSVTAKGKTPLLHAINKALELGKKFRKRTTDSTQLLAVVSDGRVNVPFFGTTTDDMISLGESIRKLGVNSVVVDSNSRFNSSFLLKKMARLFDGRYLSMEEAQSQKRVAVN